MHSVALCTVLLVSLHPGIHCTYSCSVSLCCAVHDHAGIYYIILLLCVFFLLKKTKNGLCSALIVHEKAWSCRHRFHLCCSFSYHFSTSLCHVVDNESKDAVSGSACSEPIAVLHDLCLSVSLHPILHSPYIARTLDSINTIFEWSRQTIITARYADKSIPLIHLIYLYIIYIN